MKRTYECLNFNDIGSRTIVFDEEPQVDTRYEVDIIHGYAGDEYVFIIPNPQRATTCKEMSPEHCETMVETCASQQRLFSAPLNGPRAALSSLIVDMCIDEEGASPTKAIDQMYAVLLQYRNDPEGFNTVVMQLFDLLTNKAYFEAKGVCK